MSEEYGHSRIARLLEDADEFPHVRMNPEIEDIGRYPPNTVREFEGPTRYDPIYPSKPRNNNKFITKENIQRALKLFTERHKDADDYESQLNRLVHELEHEKKKEKGRDLKHHAQDLAHKAQILTMQAEVNRRY